MDEPNTAAQVIIRPALEEDLPGLEWEGVYAHFRQVYRQAFDEVRQGLRQMLLAEAPPLLVGQVFIQFNSRHKQFADGARRGYLYSLRVRPEWRGQGLGTRLIQAAEAELRGRGYVTAVIAAAKDNTGARRLYTRLGYQVFADNPGEWKFMDLDGRKQQVEEPCWLMEKKLDVLL